MREEIDGWVAEGLTEDQSDRPLVLLDVVGVVGDPGGPEDGVDRATDDDLQIPPYMPDLVRHLASIADVWWNTPLDEGLGADLAERLGVGPFPCVEPDEYGMTEPAARQLLWKAASARRATYRIENVTSEIASRLPDSTVLINIAPARVLHIGHLPEELRPAT
jgi:hypothetical protein